MSLVRHDDRFQFEPFGGVYFWMADGATLILCRVGRQALRDRSARDGEKASLRDTFVRHRRRIETITMGKYAQGHRRNYILMVLSKELTPPPM
jgi:hypothetical protein